MAWLPMKDTVTVTPIIGRDDDWNEPIYGDPVTLKCRIDEKQRVVKDRNGNEVVSSVTFYFDKFTDIKFESEIAWTMLNGTKRTANPIAIATHKHVSNKPLITVVNV